MASKVQERLLTKYLRSLLAKHKIFHLKLSDRYHSGVPDLLVVHAGVARFVELKTTGCPLSRIQKLISDQIVSAGGDFRLIDTKEAAVGFVNELQGIKYDTDSQATSNQMC